MIEVALQDIHDPHVHLQLFDTSAAPAERFLFAKASPQSTGTPSRDPFASVHWRSDFNVAGRQWSLRMFATPEHVQSLRTWERWGILAFFLTLSATQAAFLYAHWQQTARIERLVEQRMAELRASTVRVHATMENVAEGIVTFDRHGRIEAFNPAAERLFAYPTTEVVGQHLTLLLPTALQTPETLARRAGGDAAGWLTNTGLAGAEVIGRGGGAKMPLVFPIRPAFPGGRHWRRTYETDI